MAFIDTGVSAFGGVNPGSPTGSGIAGAPDNQTGFTSVPGSKGLGSGLSNSTWALVYVFGIIIVLVLTGVIFNGKGRSQG